MNATDYITEKELQETIVEMAHALGWLVYHTYNSRRSAAGFPDLVLVHKDAGRLIFIECKSQMGRLTRPQRDWMEALIGTAKVETYVIRPSDLPRIEEVLR